MWEWCRCEGDNQASFIIGDVDCSGVEVIRINVGFVDLKLYE